MPELKRLSEKKNLTRFGHNGKEDVKWQRKETEEKPESAWS